MPEAGVTDFLDLRSNDLNIHVLSPSTRKATRMIDKLRIRNPNAEESDTSSEDGGSEDSEIARSEDSETSYGSGEKRYEQSVFTRSDSYASSNRPWSRKWDRDRDRERRSRSSSESSDSSAASSDSSSSDVDSDCDDENTELQNASNRLEKLKLSNNRRNAAEISQRDINSNDAEHPTGDLDNESSEEDDDDSETDTESDSENNYSQRGPMGFKANSPRGGRPYDHVRIDRNPNYRDPGTGNFGNQNATSDTRDFIPHGTEFHNANVCAVSVIDTLVEHLHQKKPPALNGVDNTYEEQGRHTRIIDRPVHDIELSRCLDDVVELEEERQFTTSIQGPVQEPPHPTMTDLTIISDPANQNYTPIPTVVAQCQHLLQLIMLDPYDQQWRRPSSTVSMSPPSSLSPTQSVSPTSGEPLPTEGRENTYNDYQTDDSALAALYINPVSPAPLSFPSRSQSVSPSYGETSTEGIENTYEYNQAFSALAFSNINSDSSPTTGYRVSGTQPREPIIINTVVPTTSTGGVTVNSLSYPLNTNNGLQSMNVAVSHSSWPDQIPTPVRDISNTSDRYTRYNKCLTSLEVPLFARFSNRFREVVPVKILEKSLVDHLDWKDDKFSKPNEEGNTYAMQLLSSSNDSLQTNFASLMVTLVKMLRVPDSFAARNNSPYGYDLLYMAAINFRKFEFVTGLVLQKMFEAQGAHSEIWTRTYDSRNNTLIHTIVAQGDDSVQVLHELLDVNATGNQFVFDLSIRNDDGKTPYQLAAEAHSRGSGQFTAYTCRLLMEYTMNSQTERK